MKKLLTSIENLKKTKVKNLVDRQIREFKKIRKNKKETFKELCFCILTANFNAKRGIEIQNKIGNDFLILSEKELAKRLKKLGHRYPNARANYIIAARKYKDSLKFDREWLVKNIKGLGYKESSHFLRNIGYDNFAIIDFHIVDLLTRNKIIEKPKVLSKRKYLEIEKTLRKISKKLNMDLAELDFYLWYLETGTVLK